MGYREGGAKRRPLYILSTTAYRHSERSRGISN